MNRQDHKIEILLTHISQKTDKVKSVLNLEEKVRRNIRGGIGIEDNQKSVKVI